MTNERKADECILKALKEALDMGAPLETIVDRLVTCAGFLVVKIDGEQQTAAFFRSCADRVDEGLYASCNRVVN